MASRMLRNTPTHLEDSLVSSVALHLHSSVDLKEHLLIQMTKHLHIPVNKYKSLVSTCQ